MKKLTSAAFLSLFVALTGCAFDADDTQLPSFELADDVTGEVGADADRPRLPPFELADGVVGELPHDGHPNRCEPDAFVGCSDQSTAVFCGDDGRSLVTEDCAFGCGTDACNKCDPWEDGCFADTVNPEPVSP